MLNNIRVKFMRGDEVKFISHLDLMKVFERAIRRAHIPIAYSQGFNPHPQMVFGLPLSVGVTSESEYVDIELTQPMDLQELIRIFNNQLTKGLKILDAGYLGKRGNIMKEISRASYKVLVSYDGNMGTNIIKSKIGDLMTRTEISVQKEGKKGTKEVDIRPLIFELEAYDYDGVINGRPEDEGVSCLSMLVSAGSASNLKPELLVSALNVFGDLNLKVIRVHRTGLFLSKEGTTLDPLDNAALLEA